MSGYRCPKCGSMTIVFTTMPDLMREDRFLWVVKCGGGHVITPQETDELRVEFTE